jgi:hypothetical protein
MIGETLVSVVACVRKRAGAPGPLGYILAVAMRLFSAWAGGLATLALAGGLAGCGGSGSSSRHVPDLTRVPLVAGARVEARTQQCDPGAAAYCAVQLVVYDRNYRNSTDLLESERNFLHARGWTGANGDVGTESAADSPGHKLHLTYAAAGDELYGLDVHWITRPWPIWSALSNSIFDQTPALSLVVEAGNGST